MLRKKIIIALLIGGFLLPWGQPKLQAMDPVTIAILAPVAIKAAEVMMPYVIQGLKTVAFAEAAIESNRTGLPVKVDYSC